MIEYFVEVFFRKEEGKKNKLDDVPNIDDYYNETKPLVLKANSKERLEEKITLAYPTVAYIHIQEERQIEK